MDDEDDLGSHIVEIGDHFMNNRAPDPLLEPGIGRWRCPDGTKVPRKSGHIQHRIRRHLQYRSFVAGNLILDLANTSESFVPTCLELRCHQPVLGISSVILPECPVGSKARRLKISLEGVLHLIATVGYVALWFGASSNGSRFDDPKQCLLNRIIDPPVGAPLKRGTP